MDVDYKVCPLNYGSTVVAPATSYITSKSLLLNSRVNILDAYVCCSAEDAITGLSIPVTARVGFGDLNDKYPSALSSGTSLASISSDGSQVYCPLFLTDTNTLRINIILRLMSLPVNDCNVAVQILLRYTQCM